MPLGGVVVVGSAGGCGTTTLTAGLAVLRAPDAVRILGLDCQGGGPQVLWGISSDRTVDDLRAVGGEVGPSHVDRIVHRHSSNRQIVAGPTSPRAAMYWDAAAAGRLAQSLVADSAWVADVGRGGHHIAHAMTLMATAVVVVGHASVHGAAACNRALASCDATRVVVAAVAPPGRDAMSARAFGRLLPGRSVVEVPWDPRGAGRIHSAAVPRRRGLGQALAHLAEAVESA